MSNRIKMPTEANTEEWAKFMLSLEVVNEFILTRMLEAFKYQATQPIDEQVELLRKLEQQQKQLINTLAKKEG